MSGCPDANELAQLVDGTLGVVMRATIERHLDDCPSCTVLVGELAWIIAPARSAPDGYRVHGAIGAAWDATTIATGARVALWFTPPRDDVDRLVTLRHPNVLPVHATEMHRSELCLVTDPIAGRTARAWAEGQRTHAEILAVWSQAIAGVAAMHRVDVVHGALSPEHVFVRDDGSVVVAGVGATLAPTSGYVAVEQLHGAAPSPAGDQFALCVAIWEALTGAPPFSGPTPGALAVTMMTPPDAKGPLLQVLARGLSPDPLSRWADLDALRAALARPPSSSRTLVVALGLALLAIAATIGILARL